MIIREAKFEDVEQMKNIFAQIAQIHYENRPEIFREQNKDKIGQNIENAIKNNEIIVMVAADDTSSEIYGILECKIKEVKDHINLKDSRTLWIDDIGVDEKYRNKRYR